MVCDADLKDNLLEVQISYALRYEPGQTIASRHAYGFLWSFRYSAHDGFSVNHQVVLRSARSTGGGARGSGRAQLPAPVTV